MSHDEHPVTDRVEVTTLRAGVARSRRQRGHEDAAVVLARRKLTGTASEPPRYQMIAFDLEQEIVTGRYRIGELMPTEADLVERFKVSRFTVREAFRQLERLGLVRRRRGSGTWVQSQAPHEQFTQRLQTLDDLLQFVPSRLHVHSLDKVRLTRAEAQLIAAGHGETWLRAEGVRCAIGSGTILCTATLWLRAEFSGVLRPGEVIEGAVHSRLERVFGVRIERVEVHVDSHVPTPVECRQQGLATPMPVMRMARRYSDGSNRTLQVARDSLPADRFTYRASFSRDGGSG